MKHRSTCKCDECKARRAAYARAYVAANPRDWASEHRNKAAKEPCKKCGQPVGLDGKARKCAACFALRYTQRQCAQCGQAFETRNRTDRRVARYCSPTCVGEAMRKPYSNARKMAEKRARKRAAFVESVDPLRVFERDKWRCHLCGKKVDKRLSGRDRMGPQLDHVVPLALGGEHSYANTALAHATCNAAKGVRPMGEQLALVG